MDTPPAAGDRTLPAATCIGRVALRVGDLESTITFYRDVIGLSVLERNDAAATLGAGGTPLLELAADPDAPERGRGDAGLFHTAFRVPSRGALGDALERIRDRWELDGASDHDVSEALYLADPEGNGVEVYRDRPREEWSTVGDGQVRMVTEPLDLEGVAASATGEDRAPADTDVGHVHLEVTSIDAFERFYIAGFGFDLRATYPDARFVAAGGYHHHVGANTWNGRTEPAAGRGIDWYEVVVPDDEARRALRERLPEDVSESLAGNGFAVIDPDGIEIRVIDGS
ncbi:catechol 2,3-dioxygenase [Halorubrum aquaticum]|uniref:Catechol 2,3-dioxygenase n=1 Tax=Halorubrum aquaticum TaxID=387340 RepID=A0A1I2Z6D8_9EURY|nr:VOC family protein [Halorubrum aquaticum]SFH33423.1 catechol 2,3-dioxygenase [Halorubrum aquaticum]